MFVFYLLFIYFCCEMLKRFPQFESSLHLCKLICDILFYFIFVLLI